MAAGRSLPGWAVGLSMFGSYISSISFLANPGKAYAANWNAVRVLARDADRRGGRRAVVRAVLSRTGRDLGVRASGAALRPLGAHVRGRVLPAHADGADGDDRVSAGAGRRAADGLARGDDDHRHRRADDGLHAGRRHQGGRVDRRAAERRARRRHAHLPGRRRAARRPAASARSSAPAPPPTSSASAASARRSREPTFWVVFVFGLSTHLTNFGVDQSYVQRYITARDDREAAKSVWITALLYVPVAAVFFFIGTGLFVFYGAARSCCGRVHQRPTRSSRTSSPRSCRSALAGLVVAAIFAASMDSNLNSMATLTLCDLYKRYFRPNAGERESMRVLRLSTLLWGVAGTAIGCLAMIHVGTGLDAWWNLAGLFSGGVLGLFLLGLVCRRADNVAGAMGVVVGVLVIIWMTLPALAKTMGNGSPQVAPQSAACEHDHSGRHAHDLPSRPAGQPLPIPLPRGRGLGRGTPDRSPLALPSSSRSSMRMRKPLPRGMIVPMVTPLVEQDRLDVAALERLVDRVLAGGVHGLFLLGTCGEGPSLSSDSSARSSSASAGRSPAARP